MQHFHFIFALLLLAGASACHNTTPADEVKPVVPLQGKWSIGEATTFYYGWDMKAVAQTTTPASPDYLKIEDSQMYYLIGQNTYPFTLVYTYTRDGDTLRILPSQSAKALKELTTHTLTLFSRRTRLANGVHYPAGDAFYQATEEHFSR
ncbi:hypothetical protein [Hymenobacter siberiensis]|uniref:hypothetical protein n=1 Tax=Hymenobacter siberiensis TaxID=2848396 RepID=UPI001C1E08B3|nr:hypothetical protein [Hymenobacter siberiensis]MBU6122070.1 hypothetical protein [Hymenobacter siberiensis]